MLPVRTRRRPRCSFLNGLAEERQLQSVLVLGLILILGPAEVAKARTDGAESQRGGFVHSAAEGVVIHASLERFRDVGHNVLAVPGFGRHSPMNVLEGIGEGQVKFTRAA